MSDLLARLIADGTAPELVAEVAMLLAEKKLAESTVADRRAKDRERQARRRSRDVTECHVTERDSVTDPSLSRPLSPQPPKGGLEIQWSGNKIQNRTRDRSRI